MTRKKYVGKVQNLVLAVARTEPDSKVGERLRHVRDHARMAPKVFGSYEKAWNSDGVKWMRDFYGVV